MGQDGIFNVAHFKYAPLNSGVYIEPLADVTCVKLAPINPGVYIEPLANVTCVKLAPLNPGVYILGRPISICENIKSIKSN